MTLTSNINFENSTSEMLKIVPPPENLKSTQQLLAVLVSHFEEPQALHQEVQRTSRQATEASQAIEKKPLPSDFMRLLQTMPREDLVLSVCELADSFVTAMAATREQVMLIGLVDFGMAPHQVDQLNLPTMLGSLMGKLLPSIDATKVCATCAFRAGSAANQCESTVSDIWHCIDNEAPFMCHHAVTGNAKSTQSCRGFALAKAALTGTPLASGSNEDMVCQHE